VLDRITGAVAKGLDLISVRRFAGVEKVGLQEGAGPGVPFPVGVAGGLDNGVAGGLDNEM
jgi:hypothetical protein